MVARQMQCCGMKELVNIGASGSAEEALIRFRNDCVGLRFAHAVFTGVTRGHRNYARDLADLIIQEDLGAVVSTEVRVNPNSRNPLQAYLWTPNKRALRAWWKANGTPAPLDLR